MYTAHKTLFKRFVSFFGIGFLALLCDIAFAGLLISVVHIPFMYAIGLSFLTSLTISYFPLRSYTFYGTKRHIVSGYVYFLIIATFGLLITVGGSYLVVLALGIHPLIARFFVAGISGLCNFLINTFYNFKVS